MQRNENGRGRREGSSKRTVQFLLKLDRKTPDPKLNVLPEFRGRPEGVPVFVHWPPIENQLECGCACVFRVVKSEVIRVAGKLPETGYIVTCGCQGSLIE